MSLTDELLNMVERNEDVLGIVPWASEADRWAELVFCILNAFRDEPLRCREVVDVLQRLELGNPSALAAAGDPSSENATVLRYVLRQHGFDDDGTGVVAGLLSRLGGAIERDWQGKVQRFLRPRAEAVRDDVIALFGNTDGVEAELRRGVTHWLQNALSLPLSVDDPLVQAFCAQRGISREELTTAADEIGFNLALVDDLVRLEAKRGEQEDERP